MKIYFKIILIILSLTAISSINAQIGGYAGNFARMGFGARGFAMGNALVADGFGDVSGYYNPALSSYQEQGLLNLGYTFLSLDRKLNFVSFAKKFSLSGGKQTAGISISWINAGVSNIDGRDNDTRKLGDFSTFENQIALGTSFVLDKRLSLGLGFKLYYSKLYEEVTKTSVGIDIGAVYKINDNFLAGLAIRDIGSKYKWETTKIYGATAGTITEDKFPLIIDAGVSYKLPKNLGIVDGMFEIARFYAESKYNITMKLGGEINLTDYLKFRAGIERINLNTVDDFFGNLKPGAGIGLSKNFSKNVNIGIDYSFQYEPFTHDPVQNLGVVFKFN